MKNKLLGSRLALQWAGWLIAMSGLCGLSSSHAGIQYVQNGGGKWTITIDGNTPETVNGPLPLGINGDKSYTVIDAESFFGNLGQGNGMVGIKSLVAGVEPKVICPWAQPKNVAMAPDFPGEKGYVSILDAGPVTDVSSGGSTVSLGIQGGFTASYVTQAGDTFQTIEDALVSSLDANGVDAFIHGTSLELISAISDQNTLAGMVNLSAPDPAFTLDIEAGTVPEQPSTLVLLTLGTLSLLACDWRWRMTKA